LSEVEHLNALGHARRGEELVVFVKLDAGTKKGGEEAGQGVSDDAELWAGLGRLKG
jgi:hypothetical protein